MPYNFVAYGLHTKKLCSRLSSKEVQFETENGRLAFLAPFAWLRGNVRCSSWAHWKARLPINVNWTFLSRCYGWDASSEYWLKIGVFARTGSVWPKMSGTRIRPPLTIISVKITRINVLSCGIKISAEISFLLSQPTSFTDRQTDEPKDADRRTAFSW